MVQAARQQAHETRRQAAQSRAPREPANHVRVPHGAAQAAPLPHVQTQRPQPTQSSQGIASLGDVTQAIEGLAEAVRHMYLMQQETQRAIRQEVASAMHMYALQNREAPRLDESNLSR